LDSNEALRVKPSIPIVPLCYTLINKMGMILTRKMLADMLMQYINRETTLTSLVDWAENMMQEADLESSSFEVIRDILARIGLADVREFGLTWDDCYEYLHRLGYDLKIELVQA